jgi:hypothetical protein
MGLERTGCWPWGGEGIRSHLLDGALVEGEGNCSWEVGGNEENEEEWFEEVRGDMQALVSRDEGSAGQRRPK